MKYTMVGGDLPRAFKNCQSPDFHQDESFELAHGDGWYCNIDTCGELRITDTHDLDRHTQDILEEFDTDEKLNEAINNGRLEYVYNNWYVPQFYANTERMMVYLDMTTDIICYSFDECIDEFLKLMNDPEWCKELEEEVKKAKEEYDSRI